MTLRSLLQHHSSKALVLWHSAFFVVQLSHPYMTIRKTIALTVWTFVGKAKPPLLNMLSRFVIAFLPRSKHLNFMAVVTVHGDFGAQESKICLCFHFFLLFCHEVMGPDAMHDLSFLNVEFLGSFFTLLFHPDQEAL